jgi:predicted peptidase
MRKGNSNQKTWDSPFEKGYPRPFPKRGPGPIFPAKAALTTIPGQPSAHKLDKKVTFKVQMGYLLYLPEEYGTSDKIYPVIMLLHGAGNRGDDLELLKVDGLLKILSSKKEFPFIVIAPQCPLNSRWPEQFNELITILDEVRKNYRVDTTRIYLSGWSMGGEGTWKFAMKYPERFAAIAPICGLGYPRLADKLKTTPIWVFHGDKDPVNPFSESDEMVKLLKSIGAEVKFTVYQTSEHDVWNRTYENPELYEWFLKHQKK